MWLHDSVAISRVAGSHCEAVKRRTCLEQVVILIERMLLGFRAGSRIHQHHRGNRVAAWFPFQHASRSGKREEINLIDFRMEFRLQIRVIGSGCAVRVTRGTYDSVSKYESQMLQERGVPGFYRTL